MARIFFGQMEEEKSPTKAKQPHKTANLAVHATNGAVSPETIGAAVQEPVVLVRKILRHARWWQVLVTLPIMKVAITVTYVII